MKDYYQKLGIARNATEDEVKRAYRRLAKQYHPDINKNKDAEDKFKEISEAYNVLSDPKKKKQYDTFGNTPFGEGGFHPGGQTQWDFRQGPEGFDFSQGNFEGFGNLGGLFEELFQMGGMRKGQGPQARRGRTRKAEPQKGRDLNTDLEIDFMEALSGSSRQITLKRAEKTEQLTVKIPAGVDSGSKVRVAGKGDVGMFGGESGDLFLNIHVKPHPIFWRENSDIYCEVPISIFEALLGGEITVPTLEGTAKMKIPSKTKSDQKFRLKEKGAPILGKKGARGNEYVIVQIVPPNPLNSELEEALRLLSKKHEYNPRES